MSPPIFAQGPKLGKGGIDITPSDERAAPVAPEQFQFQPENNPENVSAKKSLLEDADAQTDASVKPKLLPRETGHDIGMGSVAQSNFDGGFSSWSRRGCLSASDRFWPRPG